MKYKCTNAIGYEGRLTEGKVYDCGLRNAVDDLLVIITDDGAQSELFPDRFEEVKEPEPKIEISGKSWRLQWPKVSEEGDKCKCQGTFVLPPVEGCTCFQGHAPCSACTSNEIICDNCKCTPEEKRQGSVFPKAIIDRATIPKPDIERGTTLTEIKKLVSERKIHLIDGRRVKDGEITIEEALRRGKPNWLNVPPRDMNSSDPVERLWAVEDKKKEFEQLMVMVDKGIIGVDDAREMLNKMLLNAPK
jgi:hypothetical protein